jgi:hypothetical protein
MMTKKKIFVLEEVNQCSGTTLILEFLGCEVWLVDELYIVRLRIKFCIYH